MFTDFYSVYKEFSKEQLLNILSSPENYQPEAIEAAKTIISERGWNNDLQQRKNEIATEEALEELQEEEEIRGNAAYYKNAVSYKTHRNSFQIRITDIPRFEAALEEQNISFFREDKNIGAQLDTYPTQTYYFKDEDTDAVDQICKSLSLITAPYADAKPFFFKELGMLVIGLLIIVGILFIIHLFD